MNVHSLLNYFEKNNVKLFLAGFKGRKSGFLEGGYYGFPYFIEVNGALPEKNHINKPVLTA